MLNEMLRLLNDGGMHSATELARRLGISEGLSRLIIEDLTRRGYLAAIEADCAQGCESCSLSKACKAGDGLRGAAPLLMLTGKGRQAASRG